MVDENPKTLPDVTPVPDRASKDKKPDDKIDITPSDDATKTLDLIDRSNEASERQERANKKTEELLVRQERLAVEDKLGGRSEVTEKETPADKQKAASKALLPDGMECPGVTD